MKTKFIKSILSVLLILLPSFAGAANDFSGDSNCKALWNVDNGALTTDSKGTNTLTNYNTVTNDTVNYKQGNASADEEYSSSQVLYILDTNLNAGYPGKSGVDTTMSICFWIKPESFPNTHEIIYGKWGAEGGNQRSIKIATYTSNKIYLFNGYGSGTAEESVGYGTALSTGIWYHVGITYNSADKSYRIRIWDDNAGSLLDADTTGTFANAMSIEASPVMIGSTPTATLSWDGLIDEMVVFNDILTTDEIDYIRQGYYPAGPPGGISIPVLQNHHLRH